jgi:2,3-bisphosphoglycerate-independent phosphoglycerate mutase
MTLPPGPTALPARSLALIVLDGWGLAPPGPGNAISLARTPTFDELLATYPHTSLETCGRAVGLPDGQMGNSEVGHLNLGAGAVMRQDLTRIDDAVRDGRLGENPVIRAALAGPGTVHLIGLVSDGGVHSSEEHLLALAAIATASGAGEVVVHAFTDGRDTGPHEAVRALERVEQAGVARIASVVGRYYAMDRDRRWERIQEAYDLLVAGRAAHHASSGVEAVRAAYERGETDEFIAPTTVGTPAPIARGDRVFCFNFRPDRMRELVRALADPALRDLDRHGAPPVERLATMTKYDEDFPYPVAFSPDRPQITLPQVIAATGARQLHVAESEKYPHVTYFFGGGEEALQPGERRELAPSNRDVSTYDEAPEMSARPAAERFVAAWEEDAPRFAIINFANPDMVGHTGVIAAAVRAVEVVDECLAQVVAAVHRSGGVAIVTADHGNSDEMLTPAGEPQTAHSLNRVPLIITSTAVRLDRAGILADVAPTALALLGIPTPPQMTGRSLLAAGHA